MAYQTKLHRGICARFDAAKGHGFITVDDGSGEVFVHRQELKSSSSRLLEKGDLVQFEVVNYSGDQRKAVNVVVVTSDERSEQIDGGVSKVGDCGCDDEKKDPGTDSVDPVVLQWLTHYKLHKYADALSEAGLDCMQEVDDLPEEDIAGFIEDAGLPKIKHRRLKEAIADVKSGKYEVAELEEKEDPQTLELRKRRSNLKGYVEIPKKLSRGNSRLWYTDVDPAKQVSDGKTARTVIFIGQTGAGKTTLVQSLTNYLMKVDYDEPFRYELICEQNDKNIVKDQTKSQTVDITSYHMHNVPAMPTDSLTIVDSPGFGDTSGPQQDVLIRGKFKQFFQTVPSINAIYFVVKACTTRIGAAQKYLFNVVTDLFGNDVKKNIFILFTFADGGTPPALKAVKSLGIPFAKWFKLNNSGFSVPEMKDITHREFYKMGCGMFAAMIADLQKVVPVSTSLSSKTLQERDNIQMSLHTVSMYNERLIKEKANAEKEFQILKKARNDMDAHADFKVQVPDIKVTRIVTDHNTTYCEKCDFTCHERCYLANTAEKKGCGAMKTDGGLTICRNCPGNCSWTAHANTKVIIKREDVMVWTTKEKLLKKYNMAGKKKATTIDLMLGVLDKMKQQEDQINANIDKMRASVNRLQKIALNTKVLTEDEYFDTLIQTEQREKRPGYPNRVRQLQKMKMENSTLKAYVSGNRVSSGCGDSHFNEIIKDLEKENVPKEKLDLLKRAKNWFTGFLG